MRNMTVTPAADKITIVLDVSKRALAEATPSASGKTKVVATTSGNVPITLPGGQVVTLGLNAYIK